MDDQILNDNIRAQMPDSMIAPKPWYRQKKVWVTALVAILLIAGISWYFIWGRTPATNPTSSHVTMQIKGPQTIPSGSEGEFDILYHNGENADMTNVTLDVIYPSNFQFKSSTPDATSATGQSFNLPIIKAGKDGEVVIRGKLSGATGEDKQFLAKLNYELSNFNSQFEVDQTFHTTISAPNLTLDVSGPVQVPAGQDTTFMINYANVSPQDYDNIALMVTYPAGFKFTSSSVPATRSNNYWELGKLAMNQKGSIAVTGSFMGDNLDEQIISVQLGQVINDNFAALINSTANFQLENAPINIVQTASPSDIVNLGGSISYTIKYTNAGSVGLTNLVITDTLTSPNLVDTSKINVSDAVVTGNVITWKTATNSSLSILPPGQSGQLTFNLPLVSSLSSAVKNEAVTSSITATSAEITAPIRAADLSVKLATNLGFQTTGSYVSGAVPMQVGKSTTFAITFALTNTTDDLDSTIVTASMPLAAGDWTNVVTPDSAKSQISFNPTSGLITWNVGNVPAFTGKYLPANKVTFQITVTPSAADEGQIIKLLSNIGIEANDSFTSQQLKLNPIGQFTTSDITDSAFQSAGGSVQ